MDDTSPLPASVPHIERLRVRNFRALRDLELQDLTPLTVFIGPNGSGKSTVFDVLAFLHEAFTTSLRTAIERRYGLRELRSRGEEGPIEIEVRIRFPENDDGVFAYEIVFDEVEDDLVVLREQGTALGMLGESFETRIATVLEGDGWIWEGGGVQSPVSLRDKGELAAPLFGRVGTNGWFIELVKFVSNLYVSDLDATEVRRIPEAGPQRRLSSTGDNVANVLDWLTERHPERLLAIETQLKKWVPRLQSLGPVPTGDGRSMLQLKDAPFERSIPARYASEGTLSLLAYLTALYGQDPPSLMGFEEPEENLPPQLLYGLTEEFRRAAEHSQVLVNTHSPFVLNALHPDEVRVLYRDEQGFTRSVRAADVRGTQEAVSEGAALGNLWTQGFLRVGNPLNDSGMPGPGAVA